MRAPRRNPTLFPYTTLFRSPVVARCALLAAAPVPFQRRRDGPGLDRRAGAGAVAQARSEEHTSELQSRGHLVCRLLLEKKKGYAQDRSIATRAGRGRRPGRE